MYVTHRFVLNPRTEDFLRSLNPPFGYNGFGEFIFYRTYSRIKENGDQENWADCVIRVVNGTFSIRKDWYIKNQISWDEEYWQTYAHGFAIAMFNMKWMPPGRGLWAMGSRFVCERGAMALYNCAYTDISTKEMSTDISWLMDSLMHGVGVGFAPLRDDDMELYIPHGEFDFIIPDTREGWCLSVELKLNSYLKPDQQNPKFIYDEVREANLPIKGFGGISSGPEPLKDLHNRIEREAELFKSRKEYDSVYFKANVANHVGCCVVAGNVRRSAELMKGRVKDNVFMDLKDYNKFPERQAFGWMSNNSVELIDDDDFEMLGEIALRVKNNGEPGYINRRNMPYARIGKKMKGLRYDEAVGFNPCGEIPLENKEVCNVAETLPTMCETVDEWYEACKYATMYMSTVSLLPTHQQSTNRVVARNRRIGASIIDFSGWKHVNGVHKVTKWMRDGYKVIRAENKRINDEAGIPPAIRVTTIKPGGTGPKLPGKTPGIGNPTFDYTIRRVRVAKNSPVHDVLEEANVPFEEDVFDKYTDVFEWPIFQGPAPPAEKISLWEQAMNLILVQREWSDNAVSNTLYFRPKWALILNLTIDLNAKLEATLAEYIGLVTAINLIMNERVKEYIVPERYKIKFVRDDFGEVILIKVYEYDPRHEEDHIEAVLSSIAPVTKSVALLPHSPKGAYPQMPEEGCSKAEYEHRLSMIGKIDWSKLSGSDGEDDRYCSGPSCEIAYLKG